MLAAATSLAAQTPQCKEEEIFGSDITPADYAGISVAISGNYAVMGAANDDYDTSSHGRGSLYFYHLDGYWSEVQHFEFLGVGAGSGERIGESVSMSGDIAVAGAPGRTVSGHSKAGAVYVIKRNPALPLNEQWEYKARLTASDPQQDASFGGQITEEGYNNSQGVALDGNLLVVGAYNAGMPFIAQTGKAYIFLYNPATETWSEEAILTPSAYPAPYSPQTDAEFGRCVAISGTTVAIGSPCYTHGGKQAAGVVYIFQRSASPPYTWSQTATFTAADPGFADEYGFSVSIDGNDLIVGAPEIYDYVNGKGFAEIWNRRGATWNRIDTVTASNGEVTDEFGGDVSIHASRALISAWRHKLPDRVGIVYLFELVPPSCDECSGEWGEALQLLPTDEDANVYERFGLSVALKGQTAFIGAPWDDVPSDPQENTSEGSIYIFPRLPACDD